MWQCENLKMKKFGKAEMYENPKSAGLYVLKKSKKNKCKKT